MVQHVGGFRHEGVAVALHGGDGRLHGLLAKLLGRARRPVRDEFRRVGFLGRSRGALRHDAGEVGEGKGGHQSIRMARPARAICALASAIEYSPKWKIEAASTALAWPSRTPSMR